MDGQERSETSERELVDSLRAWDDRDSTLSFIQEFPADCRLVLPVLRELAATGDYSYDAGGVCPEALTRALAAAGAGGVATLRAMAAGDNHAGRQEAIRALGRVADPDGVPAAVEALASHLRADDPGPCDEALESLARLGPKATAAVPAIIPFLSLPWGNDPDLPRAAAYAVAEIGPPAAAAVPALLSALAGGPPAGCLGRHYVVLALGKIGPPSAAALPDLVNLIDAFVRNGDDDDGGESLDAQTAIYAVAGIGVASPEAAATLERAWRCGDESTAEAAATALRMLDPDDPRPVAWFLDRLRAATDPEKKAGFVCTLGALKANGPEVRAALTALTNDEDDFVRMCAEDALKELGGG